VFLPYNTAVVCDIIKTQDENMPLQGVEFTSDMQKMAAYNKKEKEGFDWSQEKDIV